MLRLLKLRMVSSHPEIYCIALYPRLPIKLYTGDRLVIPADIDWEVYMNFVDVSQGRRPTLHRVPESAEEPNRSSGASKPSEAIFLLF